MLGLIYKNLKNDLRNKTQKNKDSCHYIRIKKNFRKTSISIKLEPYIMNIF